jgi:hypothetical protein
MTYDYEANWAPTAGSTQHSLSPSQVWARASFAAAVVVPAGLAGLLSRRERFVSAATTFAGSSVAVMSMVAVLFLMLAG